MRLPYPGRHKGEHDVSQEFEHTVMVLLPLLHLGCLFGILTLCGEYEL